MTLFALVLVLGCRPPCDLEPAGQAGREWGRSSSGSSVSARRALRATRGRRRAVSAPHLGPVEYLFMFGSGVLHLGYFVLLQRGARWGTSRSSILWPVVQGLARDGGGHRAVR